MKEGQSVALPQSNSFSLKQSGLIVAFLALAIISLLPTPEGLPVAGQRMLGILAFAVIVWMTEAVSYPVSAAIIVALIATLVGTAPNVAAPSKILGTGNALSLALGGFSNKALALVGAALFLAAAMTKTHLDKRIALVVLSKIGSKTSRVLAGVLFVGFILAFFVPSTTARVACIVPIIMGIIAAFGVEHKSRFAGMMMIATAQVAGIWNVGIKTAAAQNMIALGFIEKMLGSYITWLDWFIAAAPYAVVMTIVLYFILLKLMPPEVKEVAGGDEAIKKLMTEMGPVSSGEKKLLLISILLLLFWSTEKIFHSFDTSTTTIVAVAIMLMPKIGVMTWKEAQARIPWGTVVLFGVGISLGSALLSTKAAAWLAQIIVQTVGLQSMEAFTILAVMSLFLIIIHLGFASATALAAAMIPIIISILQNVTTPGIQTVGLTMVLQYVVSLGFILPVNSPQSMIAYGTETFDVKDFIRIGVPLTIIAYVMVLLFGATYWKWLGVI